MTPKIKDFLAKGKDFKLALLISFAVASVISILIGVFTKTPLFSIIDANFANLFLGTTAQVFAGTTAIIFTVSALVISIASDRYSAQLLSRFVNDALTIGTFSALLLCMIVALFAIGFDTPMYQISFLLMILFINTCIGLLLFYLVNTLSFINPVALANELCEEGIQALNNEDEQLWNISVSSMGDITLKAIARNEENVAIVYIDALYRLQLAWANSPKIPLHRTKDRALAYMGLELRSPVFNQYKRALDKLAKDGDENLIIAIRNVTSDSIESLMQQQGDKRMLQGLLTQYQELAEMIVGSRHTERFSFLYAYRSMIWQEFNRISQDDFLPIVLHAFVNICEVVVNKDDRELFDKTLYHFCSGHPSLSHAVDSLKMHELPQLYHYMSNRSPSHNWSWVLQWENLTWTSQNQKGFKNCP